MDVGELSHWLRVGLGIPNGRGILTPLHAKYLDIVQDCPNLLRLLRQVVLPLYHRRCWRKHSLILGNGLHITQYCLGALLVTGSTVLLDQLGVHAVLPGHVLDTGRVSCHLYC